MKREQVEFGWIDVPMNYNTFTDRQKKALCNRIIDTLLRVIDKDLDPTINRITFLDEVLESSLISNEESELYEICEVLLDCRKMLNED